MEELRNKLLDWAKQFETPDFIKDDPIIPLDAHVAKMAHQLGITTRKTEDWKMVQQVTNYMKTIFPDDPCRGDFALFGYSINNK